MSVTRRSLTIGILIALLAAGFTVFEHAAFFSLGGWGKALFALMLVLCALSGAAIAVRPDRDAPDRGESCFCYALRDHIGVLCDGTVVPCCLDHDGDLALGNLFTQELDEILNSERARTIRGGFSGRRAVEPLCRRCGFARRF